MGGDKLKTRFKIFSIFLVILILTSCNVNLATYPDEAVKKEMALKINKYYDHIDKSMEFGISLNSLDADFESQKKISGLSLYVLKHGYKVTRISEPKYTTYEKPYAIYEVTVNVKYPDDYQAEYGITRKEETFTEKLWVNPDTRLISKINSQDDFLYARTNK